MNPQPDPMIGNIFAFIFIIAVIIYSYKAYLDCQTFDCDKFVIGYIEDYKYIEKPKPIRSKAITQNKKPQKKTKPVIVEVEATTSTTTTTLPPSPPKRDEQLYNDCINSLIALGYKKTEAKNQTKHVFDRHNVTSIQDFIKLVTINTIDFT